MTPEPLRGVRLAVAIAGLAILYVIVGRLGLELAHVQANATLFWPPTGLSLAFLVLYGRRLWPGVFLGALVVNALVGTPWIGAGAIAVGNTLEALLGAFLLERIAHFDARFARLRDVLWFGALGVLACTWISPSIGIATLAALDLLGERASTGSVWLIWWLGDIGGAALVAPLAFVLARGSPDWRTLAARGEAWAVLALVALSSGASFGPWHLPIWVAQLLAWTPLAFLIWAGLRLGPRGAVIASAVTGTIAVIGTGLWRGPFAGAPEESLLRLWAYGFTFAAAAAILAALVAERERAEQAHREADEKRRAIELQLERAQRLESLGVLASGVAHDFNNLLTAIRGSAELLREDVGPNEARALADIEHASARAAELCRQLLDYAGGRVNEPERVALRDIATDVVGMLRGSIAKKVAIDVEGQSPDVLADPVQMRQVLMNLVMNAAEAIGDREGSVHVRLGVRTVDRDYLAGTYVASDLPAGSYAALDVEDDGAGMDASTLERSFEPFFTTKEHGRGLGLAAILGVARAHGGAVKVKSTPGKGTTFTVLLPIAVVEARPERVPSVHPPSRAPGTVLVADDEAAVLSVTRRVLERAGWTVHTATDGAEAVARFGEKKDEIDLVVLDIDMPVLDGWEALDAMRSEKPGLPAVLVSGLGPSRTLPAPAIFVAKPFQTRTLMDAVQRMRPNDYG